MMIVLDSDVEKVAEFMTRNIRARDLYRVAHALSQMADLCWEPHLLDLQASLRPFTLISTDGLRPSEQQSPPTAILRD